MGDSNMQESPEMIQFSPEDINTEEVFVCEGIITQESTSTDSSIKWSNGLSNDNPVPDLDSFEDVSETDTFLPMEMVDDMGDPLEILPAKMDDPLQVDYSILSGIKQDYTDSMLPNNSSLIKCPAAINEETTNKNSAMHKVIKKFSCIQCNYKCDRKCNLNKHINNAHRQKGIKPFSCSQCSKQFTYKHTLNEHVNYVHKDLKPFKCNQCDYKFGRKFDLNRHVNRVHMSIMKPINCSHCGYMFNLKSTLAKHINVFHQGFGTG